MVMEMLMNGAEWWGISCDSNDVVRTITIKRLAHQYRTTST